MISTVCSHPHLATHHLLSFYSTSGYYPLASRIVPDIHDTCYDSSSWGNLQNDDDDDDDGYDDDDDDNDDNNDDYDDYGNDDDKDGLWYWLWNGHDDSNSEINSNDAMITIYKHNHSGWSVDTHIEIFRWL